MHPDQFLQLLAAEREQALRNAPVDAEDARRPPRGPRVPGADRPARRRRRRAGRRTDPGTGPGTRPASERRDRRRRAGRGRRP